MADSFIPGSIDDSNGATVGTGDGVVLAKALSRRANIFLQADPTNTGTIALRFGAAASTTDVNSVKLTAGASLSFTAAFIPSQQDLHAIGSAAGQKLVIWVSK